MDDPKEIKKQQSEFERDFLQKAKEYEKHRLDVLSDQSEAIREHHSQRRVRLSDIAKEVDSLNTGNKPAPKAH